MQSFNRAEQDRYKQECRDHLATYRRSLERQHAHKHVKTRAVRIDLTIDNKGRVPAEDADLTIEYPEGLLVYTNYRMLRPPELPTRPDPPKNFLASFQDMSSLAGYLPDLEVGTWTPPPHIAQQEPLNWGPRVFGSERLVRYHRQRVKHGVPQSLGSFFVSFPQTWPVGLCELSYSVTCANLAEPVIGTVRLNVEEDGNRPSTSVDDVGDAHVRHGR